MSNDSITMQPSEESEIRELQRILNLGTPALLGPANERLDLPESVYHLLKRVVSNMMRGETIVLVPKTERLTTQAAANFLGFSRPHLIKLLEAGDIPFERVGRHRRIYRKDLLQYSRQRDAARRSTLSELARVEFSEGLYEGVPIADGGTDE
jgi:excisionase family DNA binding protein